MTLEIALQAEDENPQRTHARHEDPPQRFAARVLKGKPARRVTPGLKLGHFRAIDEIGDAVQQELIVLKIRRIEVSVFEHLRTADQKEGAFRPRAG
jgi:hypothetical protein